MKNFYLKYLLLSIFIVLGVTSTYAQQLPNPGFEDWSGAKFDGKIQPRDWNASNVSQVGFNFNFAHQEAGHTGKYSMMVQDKEVGAMGITETSPGYFSLGKPWAYLEGLSTGSATAGTEGGLNFKYRPDTMSVWIKRTGNNTDKEDFYLLYYAWSGTAKSGKYKNKNGGCTSTSRTNEESDIRLALDGNECGTDQKAKQIAEGMWRERKTYGEWTNIRVPIYYFSNDVPEMMNIIFSASNYPNFRANDGLYDGNSLYIDDVELIYSSKIQQLWIGGIEWKGFDPNSSEEQYYSLDRSVTVLPEIEAFRGAGEVTNAKGTTVQFYGRQLSGSEISIVKGQIDGDPTVITVKSEDGKSTSVYKIKFVRQASTNANLANILVNGKAIGNFDYKIPTYQYELPYGTKDLPIVSVEQQEEKQTVEITQAKSLTGSASIKVTAADQKTTKTYTVNFSVGLLSDNTLKDIKVNGVSLPGFNPGVTNYRVSLPTTTNSIPTVEAVSAYAKGEQTIKHTAPTSAANLDGSEHKISVTTPGNPTPRNYKLTYKLEASSYSLLKNLQMGDNLIQNFDPEQTTYYVNLPIGTTTLPKITYEKGESTQEVTVIEGGINGVSKVIVLAGNGIDQTEYKIQVSTSKSEISSLKMIYIGGEELPGFNPTTTSYTYTLPIGTTELPAITVDKGDEYQKVNITTGGINGTTRIAVTAENGSSTIYQITFSVYKATNASLKMIYLDGNPLEGFDPNILEYYCPLPQGSTNIPVVTYEQGDEHQTVTIRDGGINGAYRITVRPQSGASQTYVLHFSVATSDNASLKMIYLDGQELEGFHPDTLNYVDTLPMGVYTVPTVTFDKGDASQKVLNICSQNIQTIKVTAESGRTQTYTIQFIIQRSNSAFLKMIYLDGEPLNGFDKDIFDYTVSLSGATSPKISVDKEEGQQVTITAPYSTGQAKIEVRPESGDPNTYFINFVNITNNTALLKNIYVDSVGIEGFSSEVFEYNISTTSTAPIITYESTPGQKVTIFRNKGVITLYVVSGKDKAQYKLSFDTQVNTDCTLRSIMVNGNIIAGFASNKYHYTISLNADETPVFGYEKQYAEQTVHVGMLDANTYNLLVQAQSGDTARYVVSMTRILSNNANLKNLVVEGFAIDFQPTQYEYTLDLSEGIALPDLQIITHEGQSSEMHQVTDSEQQVIVIAEDGKTKNVYTIRYNRHKSTNAQLKDILINGKSLAGFDSNTYTYTDTLAWRTQIVPCIQPIGAHPNQVITTYHSSIDGTSTIHVVADDGVTSQDYSIYFPVIKSSNVDLEYIEINHDGIDFEYVATTTDYHITLPYGDSIVPIIQYQAAEAEQTINYISRPLGQTSQIIVTAEVGSQRTYNLHFTRTYATPTNLLASLSIEESNTKLDITTLNDTIYLPYGTRSMTVNYTKAFAEQTVWVQPGGITSPTIITVKSNRPDEADVVYTLVPQVENQDPATLTDIKVNGATIEGFDPNRFSYIVNLDAKSAISYVAYSRDAKTEELVDNDKHWQLKVSAQGRTNTYNVWFYYSKDVIPNNDFSQWTKSKTSNTDKPTGWNVPGDKLGTYLGTAKAGTTVAKNGTSVVNLSTAFWAACGGPIPSVMNLGTIDGIFAVGGGTTVTPSGFIKFKNTPDQATIRYHYKKNAGNGALFRFKFFKADGSEHTVDHKQAGKTSDYIEQIIDLSTTNLNITGLDIIVDATGKYPSAAKDADLYVDYIRFSYNSALSGLNVNGIAAKKDGNKFSYTLTDCEDILLPTLSFTGEVADQAQRVVWAEETKNGEFAVRNATITNYAEDGTSTAYTLEVKRPLDTRNTLSDLKVNGTTISAFMESKTDYIVDLASTVKQIPDVQPFGSSSLQRISTSFADSTMTIVVTPEYGEATTYTIRFVTHLSDNTELNYLNVEGASIDFDPAQREYQVTAEKMPAITFVKNMDGQTVTQNNGVLTVTAENGAQDNYIIKLLQPSNSSTGQLSDIEVNGISMQGFSSNTYEYSLAKPETVEFKRLNNCDSVVFVQHPLYMEWQVYGAEQHSYRINYPNDLSDNTSLKAIYIDTAIYEGFNADIYEYSLKSDEPVHLQAIANDQASKLDIDALLKGDTTIYTYSVTAENGAQGTPYTFTIIPNLSDWAYLQSITINGEDLHGFRADSLQYHILVPAGEYKEAEPNVPSIGYQLGAARQQVHVEYGKLGEETKLLVISEDGSEQKEYTLLFEAEASHCVSLSGIAINGESIEEFESQRRYYSIKCNDENIQVTWASNDNFQTVTETVEDGQITLHVLAQDGVSTADYVIEIYKESASVDVTLKDILLDGQSFDVFMHDINPELSFSSMQQRYNINLPSGTLHLPEICALLNAEGQKVEISINGWDVNILVTAPDGVSTNTYLLHFSAPKSSNTLLKMIYLDGEAMTDFNPSTYKYDILLPIGKEEMPDVYAEGQEANQTIVDSIGTLEHTIYVTAEDGSQNIYYLSFIHNPSQVDTLAAIYGDGVLIEGFEAELFYYSYTLPVGTDRIPELTWDLADEWQEVSTDTVVNTTSTQIIQIHVTAGSGKKNTYTVSYEIPLSNVDTLAMIYIGATPLDQFDPYTSVYYTTLAVGDSVAPNVTWQEGDTYQTVNSETSEYVVNNVQMGWNTNITVQAQDGHIRTYMLYFVYSSVLSSVTDLQNIYLNGVALANFDPATHVYRINIAYGEERPSVFATAAIPTQTIEFAHGDTTVITVTAEDKVTTDTYTLYFSYQKSANSKLKALLMDGELVGGFHPDTLLYNILLPYGTSQAPNITYELGDVEQTVEIDSTTNTNLLGQNIISHSIIVTAADGESSTQYDVIMTTALNDDCSLSALLINGDTIEGFHADSINYQIVHPIGSDSSILITKEAITPITNDTLAHYEINEEGNKISILVTANDRISRRLYTIEQSIALSSNNRLKCILLDSVLIKDFDADITEYSYYYENVFPSIIAEAEDSTAAVNPSNPKEGEPYYITVTAQDGSTRVYTINFLKSTIKTGVTPSANDVLVKHLNGLTFGAATLRKNISIGVYDLNGHLLFYSKVPETDQNNAILGTNASGYDCLLDVSTTSTQFTLPNTFSIYFYVFFENNNKCISSGKLNIIR